MITITLLAQIQNTKREDRAPLYERIAKDHGRRFMESMRDMIDSHEMIRANEASLRKR